MWFFVYLGVLFCFVYVFILPGVFWASWCSLLSFINFGEFLVIIWFSFSLLGFLIWIIINDRLFDIPPQLLGILLCFIHFFQSLCLSLSDFYWPVFKFTLYILCCVESTDERSSRRHSSSLLPCFSFLAFHLPLLSLQLSNEIFPLFILFTFSTKVFNINHSYCNLSLIVPISGSH